MKKLLIILTSLSIISCTQKLKESELKTEKGFVVAKQYQPSIDDVIMGTGISTNGGLSVTIHKIKQKNKYNVVFKCEHGVLFTVNHSNIYGKLKEGDSVNIKYHELLNKEGIIETYRFVDADSFKY